MLEKPDLDDARLIARLSDAYGLRATSLTFLPLGADAGTAVYRVAAADGAEYFLKLRRGLLDEMSVAVPSFLAGYGTAQIIPPLPAASGRLWSSLDAFTLTLYPFVDGEDGYASPLSPEHWIELGAVLKRIHTAPLPDDLARRLPRETYSAHWREQVTTYQSQLAAARDPDPVSTELAAFMQTQAVDVQELVQAAHRLAHILQTEALPSTLCHADLHAGNLLIRRHGALHIVDWDTALLAPKERDLMFIGSGLGPAWDQPQTAAWFYQGYGPAQVDLAALAYYRCERLVQDIAAFCQEILTPANSPQDRAQSLHYLKHNFKPNGIAAIAIQTYHSAPA
jgi:spectinomycin phosphotransferase